MATGALVIPLVIPPRSTRHDRTASAGRCTRPEQRGQHQAARHG